MPVPRAPRFTQEDYSQLPQGFPAELVDGGLVREPAPPPWNRRLALEVAIRLDRAAGPRRTVVGPVGVWVDEWNILHADVAAYAPEHAVTPDSRPDTVPVLVVEVLSRATRARDRKVKVDHYLRTGVAEVWLVDPDEQSLEVCSAAGRTRRTGKESAESQAVPGFRLAWADLVE